MVQYRYLWIFRSMVSIAAMRMCIKLQRVPALPVVTSKMINMKKLLFLITICACSPPSENSDGSGANQNDHVNNLILFEENSFEIPEQIRYSELFDSCYFVPLETTEESLLSEITQIKFLNEMIVIRDNKTKKVVLFSRDGKFLRNIGNAGRGPAEYMGLAEIDVDSKNNHIFILDNTAKRILTYDLQGNLINDFNLKVYAIPFSFQYTGQGKFLVSLNPYSEKSHALVLVDSKGRILRPMLDNAIYISTFLSPSNFFSTSTDIKFMTTYMDTIYQYKDGQLSPYIAINSGSKLGIAKLADYEKKQGFTGLNEIGESTRTFGNYEGMWGIHNYHETNSFIYFQYITLKTAIVGVFVDKSTLKAKKAYLKQDIHANLLFPNFLSSNQSYFIKQFHPGSGLDKIEDFKKMVESYTGVWQNHDIKKRLMAIDAESNPVLIFYRVK